MTVANEKEKYSQAAKHYCEEIVPGDPVEQERYNRCKEREREKNETWKRNKVNLVEIVQRFAPNAKTRRKGYKFIFEGDRYTVVADLVAGYLRIRDRVAKKFLDKFGNPSDDGDQTHMKIMRKEEMQ